MSSLKLLVKLRSYETSQALKHNILPQFLADLFNKMHVTTVAALIVSHRAAGPSDHWSTEWRDLKQMLWRFAPASRARRGPIGWHRGYLPCRTQRAEFLSKGRSCQFAVRLSQKRILRRVSSAALTHHKYWHTWGGGLFVMPSSLPKAGLWSSPARHSIKSSTVTTHRETAEKARAGLK